MSPFRSLKSTPKSHVVLPFHFNNNVKDKVGLLLATMTDIRREFK